MNIPAFSSPFIVNRSVRVSRRFKGLKFNECDPVISRVSACVVVSCFPFRKKNLNWPRVSDEKVERKKCRDTY